MIIAYAEDLQVCPTCHLKFKIIAMLDEPNWTQFVNNRKLYIRALNEVTEHVAKCGLTSQSQY